MPHSKEFGEWLPFVGVAMQLPGSSSYLAWTDCCYAEATVQSQRAKARSDRRTSAGTDKAVAMREDHWDRRGDDEATVYRRDDGCQWLSKTVDGKLTITKLTLTSIAFTEGL